MNKRFQVFLSSTYVDLKEERLEVIQALLELDCIPCGMEYFPAANDSQWSYIKNLIDSCDYYIVILGGRYGSEDKDGIGYTEKEYRYAISQNIPVIAFLFSSPDTLPVLKTDKNRVKEEKLEKFKELVKTRLCKFWSTKHELGAVVSRSMIQLIKSDPRPGWIRSDTVLSKEKELELIDLYKEVVRFPLGATAI